MWCASKQCVINIQLRIVFFVLHFFFFYPTVHLYKPQTKIRRDQCPCPFLLMITYKQMPYCIFLHFIETAKSLVLTCSFVSEGDQLAACLAQSSYCNQFIPHFGHLLKEICYNSACTSSYQTTTCWIFLPTSLFDVLAAFWKHSEPKRILNYW